MQEPKSFIDQIKKEGCRIRKKIIGSIQEHIQITAKMQCFRRKYKNNKYREETLTSRINLNDVIIKIVLTMINEQTVKNDLFIK